MSQVTLTLVTGTPRAGKLLVARGIALTIAQDEQGLAVVVVEATSAANRKEVPEVAQNIDVILASRSETREPWMNEWFKRYGEPMFHVHVTRRDGA